MHSCLAGQPTYLFLQVITHYLLCLAHSDLPSLSWLPDPLFYLWQHYILPLFLTPYPSMYLLVVYKAQCRG